MRGKDGGVVKVGRWWRKVLTKGGEDDGWWGWKKEVCFERLGLSFSFKLGTSFELNDDDEDDDDDDDDVKLKT